jgi:putative DNA primase/helicase
MSASLNGDYYTSPLDQFQESGNRRLIVQRASNIPPTKIPWLCDNVIPSGRVTGIVGYPGQGKSLLASDLAAAVSNGAAWPAGDSTIKRGRVIILSAEDPPSDTLVPRLMGADADLTRISIIEAVTDAGVKRDFELACDLQALGKKIRSMRRKRQIVRLVIIDPITSYLGDINRNSPRQIRVLFDRLGAFAAEHMLAIVFVAHRAKTARRGVAMTQIAGSYEFGAGPRMNFLVVGEPNTKAHLLVPCKQNLIAGGLGYRFRIEEKKIENGIAAPVVEFDPEPVSITAEQALAAEGAKATTPITQSPAQIWLQSQLDKGPMRRQKIMKRATREGFSERQMRSARERLGIVSTKTGVGANARTKWALPANSQPAAGVRASGSRRARNQRLD